MIELQTITPASKDPITAGLVNAILNDDHAAARTFQDMVYARNSIQQNPQLTAAVENITSGVSLNVTEPGKANGIV